ncbi:MAG: GrdX protein [Clostridia bacterium]|jgi:hypothetical protein|nr:GrdX protein [Clostridia bacterium]
MKPILITNNPLVWQTYPESIQIKGSFREVLLRARDGIHRGQRLITHPLTGSLKPNQTPYKSIILDEEPGNQAIDLVSLQMIEKSLATVDKLGPIKVQLTAKMLEDYQVIDLSFIESAWDSLRPLGIKTR